MTALRVEGDENAARTAVVVSSEWAERLCAPAARATSTRSSQPGGATRAIKTREREKNVVVTMMGLVKGEQSAAFCHRPLGARAADGGAQQARPLGAARRPRLCSTTGSIRARAFSSSDDPTGTATAWR